MKIATFNVNNVNKRVENLLDWLKAARPDVACLQELKATDSEFPITAIENAGYGAVWRGQKSWNGVAILAHGCEPVVTHAALSGDPTDTQSRPGFGLFRRRGHGHHRIEIAGDSELHVDDHRCAQDGHQNLALAERAYAR